MFDCRPIVVGLDFSTGSEAALIRAADLAERFHARLHLLHATAAFHSDYGGVRTRELPSSFEQRMRTFAATALGGEDALDLINPAFTVRRGEAPGDALISHAKDIEAGLIVVGSHGLRGIRHFVMGSVAEEVARFSPIPVLTIPNHAARTAPSPTAPVLVPVDFSTASQDTLARAKSFAARFEAPVELLHVIPSVGPFPSFYEDVPGLFLMDDVRTSLDPQAEQHTTEHLERLDLDAGGAPARAVHVRYGRPENEIETLAAEIDPGLIVMATHGLSGFEHFLLGSVTERTLRRAACPVLSFRQETSAS